MEEEDNIIVKWAQEDVETSYNLLNNNNNNNFILFFCVKIWNDSQSHAFHARGHANCPNGFSTCLSLLKIIPEIVPSSEQVQISFV